MFCTNCGKKVNLEIKFCSSCGSKVDFSNISKSISTEPTKPIVNNHSLEGLSENKELGRFWPRFGAYIFDYALAGIGGWLIIAILIGTDSAFYRSIAEDSTTDRLATFGLVILYHIICLSIFSTTLGKKLFGLSVIDSQTKQKITIKQSIIRSFAYVISSVLFGIGFWRIVNNPKKQGMHDEFAKTLVVRDKKKSIVLGIILAIIAALLLILTAVASNNDDTATQAYKSQTNTVDSTEFSPNHQQQISGDSTLKTPLDKTAITSESQPQNYQPSPKYNFQTTPSYSTFNTTPSTNSFSTNPKPINVVGGANYYNRIGNTTYGSDGSYYNQIGNTTYGSDGTYYNRIGNSVYGSDGSSYNTIGNTTYRNDGTSCTTIGSSYYCTDGSSGVSY